MNLNNGHRSILKALQNCSNNGLTADGIGEAIGNTAAVYLWVPLRVLHDEGHIEARREGERWPSESGPDDFVNMERPTTRYFQLTDRGRKALQG